ncbi:virulence factor TspB C-terminal domain-related protein [Dyella soli]|uniref:Uncharacterized protein n=1 Tax=Dyella soli TaxID=522319 RepID=A0A4R0YUX6_9GAMM|nr:virulence factor TspB C-terminal domain-related protein [Dyella soli]TCI10120.1 hypothetical protein EZM97_14470 [Dyella soli]
MDSLFPGRVMRVVASLLVVLALSLFAPRSEATTYATPAAAQAGCIAEWNAFVAQNSGNAGDSSCILWNNSVVTQPVGFYGITGHCCGAGRTYKWDTSTPPSNPCSSLAPLVPVYVSFKQGQARPAAGATWTLDPITGAKVQCPFNISYSDAQELGDANGNFWVKASETYTGNPTGAQSTTPVAGSSNYNDSTGGAMNPQPSSQSDAPQICGGGSCVDKGTNQACAVAGGAQVCVPLSTATTPAGGCSSGGGATVCAGTPTAPSPVGQPNSTITDPATQIKSSDKYTTGNVQTGAVGSTIVNVFSSGAPTTNGAKPGSVSATKGGSSSTLNGQSGPASSSSTGNGDSFNGGSDCNAPPACQGDAVMCGIAQEQWNTMCSAKKSADDLYKSLAGDGTGPQGADPTPTQSPNSSMAWQSGTSTGNSSADAANQGNYDMAGLGFSSACPLHDMSVPLPGGRAFDIKFSNGCELGGWLRAIIIAFALFAAAKITAGGVG